MRGLSPSDKVIISVGPAGTSQDMNLVLNKPKTSPLLMTVSHTVQWQQK